MESHGFWFEPRHDPLLGDNLFIKLHSSNFTRLLNVVYTTYTEHTCFRKCCIFKLYLLPYSLHLQNNWSTQHALIIIIVIIIIIYPG